MYMGLLKISTRKLFSVTNGLIILLAAGMASQGVGFLISADLLPTWGDAVWDTSWLLTDSSIVGKMLHALVGYTARPAGIQIVAYMSTLAIIVTLVRRLGHPAAQAVARKQTV
jgi:high-affinity iron transporter